MSPDTLPPALVADIGGTHARLALAREGRIVPGSAARLENARFDDPLTMLADWLEGRAVSAASLAVAGPVRGGRVRMGNRHWTLEEGAVSGALGGVPCRIVNDLAAQALALPHLARDALRPLLEGAPLDPAEPRLVIGLGTGFNSAVALPSGAVLAAESGQGLLPARDAQELRTRDAIAAETGYPRVEDALSGPGLARLARLLSGGSARAPETILAAARRGEPDARAAVALFARFLGLIAGELALGCLPHGGIALAGGLARAVAPLLRGTGFAARFHDRGAMRATMESFAIGVIEDDHSALAGCAALAATLRAVPTGPRGFPSG
jgi:glucokinase